jgi:hypothetical protein
MPAPTRFKRVQIGDNLNTGIGQAEAFGSAVVAQSALLAYTDTAAKNLFVIPANSQILDVYVDVLTVFNSDGTDLVDIGVSGTSDLFADALDVSSLGRKLGSSDVSQLLNYDDTGTSQITVQGIYANGGSAATTGNARVTIVYCPGNDLE